MSRATISAKGQTTIPKDICVRLKLEASDRVEFVEIVWALESCYDVNKQQIVKVFQLIAATRQLQLQNPEVALRALRAYQTHSLNFAEALNAVTNQAHGCETTFTLDRKAAKTTLFRGAVEINQSILIESLKKDGAI